MSTAYFVILVCGRTSSNTDLTLPHRSFYEEHIILRKQLKLTSPNDGMPESSHLEDDMKERKVPGKQVKMAPASLRHIKSEGMTTLNA